MIQKLTVFLFFCVYFDCLSLFSQSYFLSISLSEKLCYNPRADNNVAYIDVPGNQPLQRDLNQNRLMLYSLTEIPAFLSFGVKISKMLFELGIQSDRIMKRTGVTSLYSTGIPNNVNIAKATEASVRNLYGFMVRGYYCVYSPADVASSDRAYQRLYLFAGIDFLSTLINYSEKGMFALQYVSENMDTISIVPTETYYKRIAPRLHFGLSLNLYNKKGRCLFNFRTYWGTNSFITLADYLVQYSINGIPFHTDKAKMGIGGWYFVLSKDFWLRRKQL